MIFEFSVKSCDPALLHCGNEAALPAITRTGRVLLAEDNKINQKLAKKLLERRGLTVVIAENGQEVIDLLQSDGPFDLIFMDCQMPTMDGYDSTRLVRSRKGPEAKIPIIALTANAMSGDRERCIESGMSDYLPKPISLSDLDKVLSRWLPGGEVQILQGTKK